EPQVLRTRADKDNALFLAPGRKLGVFRQKAVPRVDRVDLFALGDLDDALDVQVGLDGTFAPADQVGLVRLVPVQREAVFFGINGDGLFVKFAASTKDADRDLAAIGGQHSLDLGQRPHHSA